MCALNFTGIRDNQKSGDHPTHSALAINDIAHHLLLTGRTLMKYTLYWETFLNCALQDLGGLQTTRSLEVLPLIVHPILVFKGVQKF